MTTPTPEQAARRAPRIVEVARAFVADPDNMDKRVAYMRAVFNHDWTAAAIVALADANKRCVEHPERPSRTNLDGEELCQECADAWVRGEGMAAAEREAEEEAGPDDGASAEYGVKTGSY